MWDKLVVKLERERVCVGMKLLHKTEVKQEQRLGLKFQTTACAVEKTSVRLR